MQGFRLLTYADHGGQPRAGLLADSKVFDLERVFADYNLSLPSSGATVLALVEEWERSKTVLQELGSRWDPAKTEAVASVDNTRLLAPLLYPSNIYCAAANYSDHTKEMTNHGLPPKDEARPYFFTKAPRQTVIGPNEAIRIPNPNAKVDWEAEVGVVIGHRCRNVSAADAMNYVAGYVIIHDVSDRAANFRNDWHFKIDWFGGKSFDTSAPMGPWITPADQIPDPHDLAIRLWVNDELKQDASSEHMYFTIPEQIEYLSERLTLLPGDVIATGTPAGVGHPLGTYLKPGDTVKIEVEGLGSITNPVVAGY